MRAPSIGLVVGGLLLMASSAALAQTNQIKPRVLIMLDTSGSMTEHMVKANTTACTQNSDCVTNCTVGGVNSCVCDTGSCYIDSLADGSLSYTDSLMSRSTSSNTNYGMYPGIETTSSLVCPATSTTAFDGSNSRIFNGKAAITNVVNGSGDIDWGLMRYSGSVCGFSTTTGGSGATCTTDNDCTNADEFCIGGKCHTDGNLCKSNNYGGTDHRGTSCADRVDLPTTYAGDCGTSVSAGAAPCNTQQVCYQDSDCSGTLTGRCATITGGVAKSCTCGVTGATCPTNYTCTSGRCVYNVSCRSQSATTILVDPSAATFSPTQLLSYVDNVEDFENDGTGKIKNPELRAVGSTPLAAAARAATSWYTSVVGSDSQAQCRPYVLVQITDGFDTCDSNSTAGPVAAAQGFVAATVPGKASKPLNKVYVIGLSLSSPTLDSIAAAGGTGQARLATSQQDIEAALADIVASSVLVEKCNGMDDNCNGQCDENFPGVQVNATGSDGQPCSNPHPASTCDNGLLGQCKATGVFVCSADQLSQVCQTPTCTAQSGATISSPSTGVMRLSNTTGTYTNGQVMFVSGSTKVANNGGFLIAGSTATTVDLTNPGVVVPDASSVTYAVPPTQGKGTTAVSAGNVTITVTAGSTSGLGVGATIFVLGAGSAANNGQFTISAVTATTITYGNAGGVGADTVTWAVDICQGVETCNGLDDNCDGIIDNCGGTTPGSCCTSNCPACAKAPFIETCNNCDDDCDGIIDDHLVDTGLSCGNNVGDCAGGLTMCCSSDPNLGACTINGTTDKIYCKSGNPGYPVSGPDLCDGTDDNCNGVANDEPPLACFTDGVNTLPMSKDGVGVCHHGIEQCLTLPLCGSSTVTPPNCITGACPAGWPAGKTCPNPTPTYGACQGLVVPSPEFCDGLDNDCNACIDDNPQDAWIGTECCSTGNLADCDNTGTGTRCHRGHWQCAQPGGACTAGSKQCIGSIAKSTEVCNMIDDDCNGLVDDLPGIGAPCTGTGIYTGGECKAVMQCVTTNQPPQCVQTVGPMPETCNGKDDNCNGQIDDTNPPLAPANGMLPGTGVQCDIPMPPADKPPCKPGLTVCQAGMIVCIGAVGPMPNQCNGISTDCTGNPNTNGNCPTGFECYQGNCVAPCQGGEFPCPGGYACDLNTNACDVNGVHSGCCVPDACVSKTCPLGYICQLDASGNANCIDPCVGVTCPTNYICKLGACVDGTCRTQGCPDGQVCVDDPTSNMFVCQPDPCANVMCDSNQFCEQGVCVNACAGPCPTGQYCSKGQCVPDPCAHTPCVEGQVCQVQNGVGVCVENQCQFGCNLGQACCGGECVADQCENLHCPEDTHCTLTPDCQATCETNPASPKDQVVGAGGGGFGCAVAAHGAEASSSLVWLIAVAGALLFRRRRTAEVRK